MNKTLVFKELALLAFSVVIIEGAEADAGDVSILGKPDVLALGVADVSIIGVADVSTAVPATVVAEAYDGFSSELVK